MGDLPRRAANREWNQPKREKCEVVNETGRSWRSKEPLTSDVKRQSLEFAQLGFSLALVQYFLTMPPLSSN